MTSEFFYSSAIYDSKTVSRVHWAIIPSRLWPMTSPYSFLWGGGVISDSVEASSPHGIGQPTLVCSPLSSLPTTADPGLQQPPRGSTLKRFLQMTGFLCSIHKVPLGRGWGGVGVWGWTLAGLQSLFGANTPPSAGPGLAQSSGLHGGREGKLSVVLPCHVYNIPLNRVTCLKASYTLVLCSKERFV